MYRCSALTKTCASCANWGGSRTPIDFNSRVSVSAEYERGPCFLNPLDRGSAPTGKRADSSCFNWVKWGALTGG